MSHGLRLETWRWETNAVPQIGPLPQQGVDRQLPRHDIYLGIMSARFGTPTGDGHGSGTEKEFRDALAMWKDSGAPWILFYFDEAPKMTGRAADALQYAQVCQFRGELQTLGLVAGFNGLRGGEQTFFEQVNVHLRKLVRQLLPASAEERPAAKADDDGAMLAKYRAWLARDCGNVELLGLQELLVRRWFRVLSSDEERARQLSDELLALVAQRSEVVPLVANPMLLTAMCVIFSQGKRMPHVIVCGFRIWLCFGMHPPRQAVVSLRQSAGAFV